LLKLYGDFYRELARSNPGELNKKLPRDVLATSFNRIGVLILAESQALAVSDADVRQFLDENKLPVAMSTLLPDEFRVFCLLLNALKQWLSAEQAATDRYLLGGSARPLCRAMLTSCLVTGEPLTGEIDLHHPVRDGRPPIPLSKEGHRIIEEQTSSGEPSDDEEPDDIARAISEIKERNKSWRMLRRGCRLILGLPAGGGTKASNASAKTLARRAIAKTGRTAQDLLNWMDANELGVIPEA
jgi:hypothetical protein